MKAKLIKKDDDYFLEVEFWYPKYIQPSIIANTFVKPKGEVYDLCRKNCDEIFGVVDVEKLAEEYIKDDVIMPSEKSTFIFAFLNGMELNKDKVFTLEDMVNYAWYVVKTMGEYASHESANSQLAMLKVWQSLQQPTEIEVEIVMENYGYCEGCRKAGMWHCTHADTCGYAETRERPKLDSSGCLVLKRK